MQYLEVSWTGDLKGKDAYKIVKNRVRGVWGRPSYDNTYVCVNIQGKLRKSTLGLIKRDLKELGAQTVKITYTWEKSWGTKQ